MVGATAAVRDTERSGASMFLSVRLEHDNAGRIRLETEGIAVTLNGELFNFEVQGSITPEYSIKYGEFAILSLVLQSNEASGNTVKSSLFWI